MRRRTFIQIASGSAIACSRGAQAQDYPSKPLTIVVPYSAGGPTDTLTRILAEHMQTSLGQNILIDNVTGAGGATGVARVARANPDGYTISTGNPGSHITVWALQSASFDLRKDLAPVVLFATNPAPDIPTADEAGLPGFQTSVWHAMWVPSATPAAIIGRLNVVVREALANPRVRQRFADLGQETEIQKWAPLMKAAKLTRAK